MRYEGAQQPDEAGGEDGPAYESDRIDPVEPSAKLRLDQELLTDFPEGYRHLAYLQTRIGYQVKRDMPGLTGTEVEQLYARGVAWLAQPANAGVNDVR